MHERGPNFTVDLLLGVCLEEAEHGCLAPFIITQKSIGYEVGSMRLRAVVSLLTIALRTASVTLSSRTANTSFSGSVRH